MKLVLGNWVSDDDEDIPASHLDLAADELPVAVSPVSHRIRLAELFLPVLRGGRGALVLDFAYTGGLMGVMLGTGT